MMDNEQIKQLCLSLMEADTEEEVITILRGAGYWDDRLVWRFYGDFENNYSTIGNQAARPDAALIEKLVNSLDARLMNECLVRGIDPEGPSAPRSIQEAVAAFFEDGKLKSARAGLIKEWDEKKRTEIARDITLTATGAPAREGNPCFTISDCGEGQTPEMMPVTLLSLVRENKLRIPFVQGKFNMGGTGALKFCGRHGLQLIVSRRNPNILRDKLNHPSDLQWGFTIVRREDPGGAAKVPSLHIWHRLAQKLPPPKVESFTLWQIVCRFSPLLPLKHLNLMGVSPSGVHLSSFMSMRALDLKVQSR
jgi:hypothetical protein